jgi:hypothetical protein
VKSYGILKGYLIKNIMCRIEPRGLAGMGEIEVEGDDLIEI